MVITPRWVKTNLNILLPLKILKMPYHVRITVAGFNFNFMKLFISALLLTINVNVLFAQERGMLITNA